MPNNAKQIKIYDFKLLSVQEIISETCPFADVERLRKKHWGRQAEHIIEAHHGCRITPKLPKKKTSNLKSSEFSDKRYKKNTSIFVLKDAKEFFF